MKDRSHLPFAGIMFAGILLTILALVMYAEEVERCDRGVVVRDYMGLPKCVELGR